MKTIKYLLLLTALILCINACKEEGRFEPSTKSDPPGIVTNVSYEPLYGGARFFFEAPANEDLLQIEAEYTNKKGQTFMFTTSYFKDSLDVFGFPDINEYTVQIYAVNRANVRSAPTSVKVTPLEPAYQRVIQSIEVKPGFSSFFLDWKNEIEQTVNVFVDFSFTQNGTLYSYTSVFTSNLDEERRFVNDLYLTSDIPVEVNVRVEDLYGNATDKVNKGPINLLEDIKIPKDKWFLLEPNEYKGGIPMCFGNGLEGRNRYVIDDIIDRGDNLNFMHTHSRGRTGIQADGNMPWNFIIDLGDYYELSRIITVQRHTGGIENIERGQYYQYENVGIFRLYIWDDETESWGEALNEHKIPVPLGLSGIEYVRLGEAGDMAYFYPENPQYTKPTRWFRYEAYKGFGGNYTLDDANCLSEISLYGKKASR